MSIRNTIYRSTALAVLTLNLVQPALADCYDILGCDNKNLFSRHYKDYLASIPDGPNCDFLFMMRNRIYQQHGYCFATARGESELTNSGCSVRDPASVRLNNIERANIAAIQRAERAKNCVR